MANQLSYSNIASISLFDSLPTVASTGPASLLATGNIYFVQSSNAAAKDDLQHGGTPANPFKTLNFALTQVFANNGDAIFCLPGHVETVSAAAGLNFGAGVCDGVQVFFEGNGADRAQINFATSTAAQVVVAANNVALWGPRFVNAIDALVSAVSITGSDCTIANAEFLDAPAIAATIQIQTSNAAKRLTINGYTYYESTTGTAKTEAIRIVGGDHHRLINLNISGSFSTANVNNVTTLTTVLVGDQWYLNNLSAAGLAFAVLTTSTFTLNNYVLQAAAGVAPITAGNIGALTANGAIGISGTSVASGSGAEASISKTVALPQTGNATLFTVAGGSIEILQILGLVTTVIGAVANVTKLTYVPTVGGSNTDITTGVDLNAAAAGDLYILQTSFATAASLNTAGVESIAQVAAEKLVYPLTVAPGLLRLTTAGSDGGTGRIQWSMRYRPLSPLATVV